MRNLIIYREPMLKGFALLYRVVVDRDRDEFIRELDAQEDRFNPDLPFAAVLRNGETRAVELDDGAHTFFVAILMQNSRLITTPVEIPAGTEDVGYLLLTDKDVRTRMGLAVIPIQPRA